MLRWKYFVQSEDDAFVKIIEAFTKATGVKVTISRESYEDVQPKAVGRRQYRRRAGHVLGSLLAAASCSRRKCSTSPTSPTISARNTAAGCPARKSTARARRQEMDRHSGLLQRQLDELPHFVASQKAGFKKFPKTTDEFLDYATALQEERHARWLRARSRLRRRQCLGALVPLVARRQSGRQERQGDHQLAGDGEGARIRQEALRAT